MNGVQHYLWRAVDQNGAVIDILVQPKRDRWPALRFFRKLLHVAPRAPRVIITDKLRSYAACRLRLANDGLNDSKLWKSGMYTYLGLEDGIPVSAAATVQTGDCLFLALVATAPEAQGKGFGEATVRKASIEGVKATGLTRSVLHATPAGGPVYERIGFRKVAVIHFYGLRP